MPHSPVRVLSQQAMTSNFFVNRNASRGHHCLHCCTQDEHGTCLPAVMSAGTLHMLPARLSGLCVWRRLSTRRLHSSLVEAALAHGERTALVDPAGRHTYRQLVDRAGALAERLRRAAPEPGARVALLAPPGHQFVAAQWAVWMAGHVGETETRMKYRNV